MVMRIQKQTPQTTRRSLTQISEPEGQAVWDMMTGGDSFLVYGRTGTGKTRFAGTFPGRIRWFICSGSEEPGELKSIDTPENQERVVPKVIETMDTLNKELDYKNKNKYDVWVLDHLTAVADVVLAEIMGVHPREIPPQKGWKYASKEQYQEQSLKMKKIIRSFLNLGGKRIILGQEKVFRKKINSDEDGDSVSYDPDDVIQPAIGIAVGEAVCNFASTACDYVVQTFKRRKMISKDVRVKRNGKVVIEKRLVQYNGPNPIEFCMRTEPHEIYMTKFRIPPKESAKLPDVIVDPSYAKVMKVIGK